MKPRNSLQKKAALVELTSLKSEEYRRVIAQGEALDLRSLPSRSRLQKLRGQVLKAIGTKSRRHKHRPLRGKKESTMEDFALKCAEITTEKYVKHPFEKAYKTTVTLLQSRG